MVGSGFQSMVEFGFGLNIKAKNYSKKFNFFLWFSDKSDDISIILTIMSKEKRKRGIILEKN